MVAGRVVTLATDSAPAGLRTTDVRLVATTVRYRERDSGKATWWNTVWLPEAEVPSASMRRIEFRDHGRGALWGVSYGALLGALGGALVSSMARCDRECPAAFVPLITLGGAAALGLIGAGVGGAVGVPTTIEFQDSAKQ
jgi:hypothetical protein